MTTRNRHVVTGIARVLLGLGFLTTGLNYFLHFLKLPSPPPAAAEFMGALVASGYVMMVVKVVEIGAGLLLLSNRFVPLALTLLAPLLVGIIGFHLSLAPREIPLPAIFLVLELLLAISYRAAFAPMLRARVEPALSIDEAYHATISTIPAV